MRKLYKLKSFGLLILLCIVPLIGFAQSVQVRGIVSDDKGEPLVGVAVQVADTQSGTIGTVTDIDGNYSIIVKPASKLKFSYLGYQTVITPVNGRANLNISMEPETQALDEVVVIAYGQQKKVTITGAVSNISSTELLKSPAASLGNALAGKLPGVSSIQFSGRPGGDDPTILVRGIGSLSQDGSAPLILVDGVERSFTQIDPNEVADISVLKDASATAVFGVRGANGVILVTTKRGESGKSNISVSSSWGVQMPTRLLEFTNSYDYATFYNNIELGDEKGSTKFSPEAIQAFKDGSQPLLYPNMDWTDYILKNAAFQQQYNVNISGGSEKARYFASVGLLSQDGLFNTFDTNKNANFNYNRYNYRANVDLNLSKTSILSVNLGGRLEVRNSVGGEREENIFQDLMSASPMSGAGLVDGKRILSNPVYLGDLSSDGLDTFYGKGYRSTGTNVLNLDLMFTQKLEFITSGLSFKIKGSYNSSYTHQKIREGQRPYYKPLVLPDGTIGLERYGDLWDLGYKENSWFSRDWYAEASLNYQRKFGLHDVSALLLYNQSKKYYPSLYEDIPMGYVGLVGRITYNYASRYLVDMNMGYNGSENFASGKRYGLFPSVSAGWILSEEAFMENQQIINYLKLRYSYGIVGNDNMGGRRFLYRPGSYEFGSSEGTGAPGNGGGYNFGTNNSTFLPNIHEASVGNPDVTWETATKQNLGIDVRVLKEKLSINVDLFSEKRRNILIDSRSSIPEYTSLGSIAPPVNFGKVDNKGYEISLNWTDKIGKDFQYTIAPNMSYNHNVIVEMAEVRQDQEYQYRTGHCVNQPFGYEFWGFYEGTQSEEKYKQQYGVSKFPAQMASLKPGDCIYVDLNGDGVINTQDTHAIGNPDYPSFSFGLNLGFNFKGFDFSMLWTGATDVSRNLQGYYRPSLGEQNKSALLQWVHDNSWTAENANNAILPRVTFVNLKNNNADSRIWLVDASYLRLKNIEIGYNFTIPQLKPIENIRVFATGYNLLTFSKFEANDPESGVNGSMKYPLMRIVNFGLRVNL